ncbi:phosphotransferase enzyme family protein [Streptomyces sp. NPDC059894]|uniref:phosphotransferase enzyme family protein n=1 Tax=unclassified Streptomyces TaxID=2593676 RepID=UPI00365CC6CC
MSTLLAHGLGHEAVRPDWEPLTEREVTDVLGRPARLLWRSPRPLSAAALVDAGRTLFVKRHHVSVRTPEGLAEEHAFLRHLRDNGAPVVDVLSATGRGEWVYEVHTAGTGTDLYRDALSWSPFASAGHARQAGAALARLHLAAAGFDAPRRRVQPLVSSFTVFADHDPVTALHRYVDARPALADALTGRPWRDDLERLHLPYHRELAPHLDALEPLWTHNDWHASNLLWDTTRSPATVSTVLDLGLSDRTTAVHDLAVALERNIVQWLDLPTGEVRVHLTHLDALLDGYTAVRPLTSAERAALPALLPLVNAEYALSEMDYFRGVTRSETNTSLAYAYFTDHTAWFGGPAGRRLLDRLRDRLDRDG